MKAALTTILLAVTCFHARAVSVVNGPVYNPANGHNYFLLSPATWTESEAFAQTLGGHLVTFNDAAENAWVFDNVNIDSGPDRNPHMGLNDIDEDGVWTWISGEPVTYLNWAPGEPNFPGEQHDYSNIFGETYPGAWNNIPNSDVLYGIAEVPEPSALTLAFLALAGAVARFRRRL